MRIKRFDEMTNSTRRRGIRVGWYRWKQDHPPYHYENRWIQAHILIDYATGGARVS